MVIRVIPLPGEALATLETKAALSL
jgi:hypothetical protein